MDKIKVMVKKVGENPEVVYIENDFREMQKLVGGYMERVPFWPQPISRNVDLMCNEEGKMIGLEPNFAIPGDVIMGDVFFSRHEGEDTVSLTDQDVQDILSVYGGQDQ